MTVLMSFFLNFSGPSGAGENSIKIIDIYVTSNISQANRRSSMLFLVTKREMSQDKFMSMAGYVTWVSSFFLLKGTCKKVSIKLCWTLFCVKIAEHFVFFLKFIYFTKQFLELKKSWSFFKMPFILWSSCAQFSILSIHTRWN